MKNAIQKAIEEGYMAVRGIPAIYHEGQIRSFKGELGQKFDTDKSIFLDQYFWECLGKAMGWELFISKYPIQIKEGNNERIPQWLFYWHSFIDHIADGGDIDTFFNNLLTNK